MYKKILVPLDGSERAEAILPHVEEIAHCHGSNVLLIRVIDPVVSLTAMDGLPMDMNMEIIKQQIEDAEVYLKAKQGELLQKKIEAHYQVMSGAVANTIVETAEKEEADLIAIASHGRGGLARVFYGSVAAALLQRVDRPLLLIRAR